MLKVFGHSMPVKMLLLGMAEILAIALVLDWLLSAGVQPSLISADLRGEFVQTSVIFAGIAVLSMFAMGLYDSTTISDYRGTATKTLVALLLIVPANLAAIWVFHDALYASDNSRAWWIIKAPAVWMAVILFTRFVCNHALRTAAFKRRVFVLGEGTKASSIRGWVSQGLNHYFEVVGYYEPAHAPTDAAAGSWVEEVKALKASEIVVAVDDRRGLPVDELLAARMNGLAVIDYQTFCERETGRLDLEALQPSWLIFSSGFTQGAISAAVKRAFDIIVASAMLILTLPLMLITAVLIKAESEGPIFYRQERVGLNGRSFNVLKFRSMRVDAEKAGVQWARANDNRVTRVGAFIRKVRIDELPQLLNVLKDDMSFIGPRPERPFFVEQLTQAIPFYRERHSVKPGITGWAQVNYPYGASLEDARNKLSYDLYYVKNRSLFLDLIILISTVRVILLQEGAR
ncbi:TIGR03013 family XrtA/PEP-CTERM system glycosyltransferase [Roseiterribacter gracilis]|uniref:Sugar transferase n=1 Tax=Roseiterribacter gracilis TaxID=2812848 RepID=A0A8S8XBN7_9PROT|nr:sugar transferase [Rhodospirillales bacterium TMPK1]